MTVQKRIDADRSWQGRLAPFRSAAPKQIRYSRAYSKFVRWTKLTLPLIAVGLVVTVALWAELKSGSFPSSPKSLISDLRLDADGVNRATNTLFSNIDSRDQPFTLTADSVVQLGEVAATQSPSDERFSLENPKAKIRLTSGAVVQLTSPEGEYSHGDRKLELTGGVRLTQPEDYEILTTSAAIDFASMRAWSHKPVTGSGRFGFVEANGLEVQSGGDVIIFSGPSRLMMKSEKSLSESTR